MITQTSAQDYDVMIKRYPFIERCVVDVDSYPQEMRFYSFVNALYTREVQHGIQSAHAMAELFNKVSAYKCDDLESYRTVFNWSENWKTMIILNGGIVADLEAKVVLMKELMFDLDFQVPWATFNEDQASLGGILTAVGMVLPEMYFNAIQKDKLPMDIRVMIDLIPSNDWYWVVEGQLLRTFTAESSDGRLISMVKSCGLAR